MVDYPHYKYKPRRKNRDQKDTGDKKIRNHGGFCDPLQMAINRTFYGTCGKIYLHFFII